MTEANAPRAPPSMVTLKISAIMPISDRYCCFMMQHYRIIPNIDMRTILQNYLSRIIFKHHNFFVAFQTIFDSISIAFGERVNIPVHRATRFSILYWLPFSSPSLVIPFFTAKEYLNTSHYKKYACVLLNHMVTFFYNAIKYQS